MIWHECEQNAWIIMLQQFHNCSIFMKIHKLQDTNKNAIQDHVNHDRESSFNPVASRMDDPNVHSG